MTKSVWGNPYTHEEHSRESLANTDGQQSCNWCGQRPRILYKYDEAKGWFCNKECHRSYHS